MPFKPGMTNEQLEAEGYTFDGTSACRGRLCGRDIEWWITPNQSKLPLDPVTHEPHWATCPNSRSFKKKA